MGSAFFGSGRNDCEQIEERLEAYLSGTMPEGVERNAIAAHLSDCPACRERVTEYTRLGEAFSSYRAAPLPERAGDWRAVRARLETSRPERRLGWGRPVFGGQSLALGIAAAMVGFTAVALPRVREQEAAPTPEPTPTVRRVDYDTITRGEPGSIQRLMQFATVGKGGNTLAVAQTFVGSAIGTAVPLVVEISNSGEGTDARLEVRPQRSRDSRQYQYDIRLEKGQTRFQVYPAFNPNGIGSNLVECEVTLTAPGRRQKVSILLQPFVGNEGAVAYVGDRFGAVSPKSIPSDPGKPVRYPSVRPDYVAVEYAPDQAVGYSRYSMVVLSPEAARMNAAQWRAIREWVTTGGHLVMTSDRLLEVPFGGELAPVRKVTRNAFGTSYVPIKEAAESETQLPPALSPSLGTITRRQWGMGTVYFTSFDPSAEEFRTWTNCNDFWEKMLVRTRGRSAETFRFAAHRRAVADTPLTSSTQDDAFRLTLPSVQFVLFLFLGYFVLVVPVTFAVLKHTRRLNMAWVTGPALAVVFAGGVFLLTARLYFMPTARRTAGVVFLHSGERTGRFVGNTEVFFPKAGRYDLAIPGADSVEMTFLPEDRERPLDSRTDKESVTTAALSVGNLAFRRVHHEQSVDLPGAVLVELKEARKGELIGFVENNTGKPLVNAALSDNFREKTPRINQWFGYQTKIYPLGTLPPGRTMVHTEVSKWIPADQGGDYMKFTVLTAQGVRTSSGQPMPLCLTLMAQTAGEAFGPRIGRDFSGERSVTMLVGVDAQKTGGTK